MKRFSIFALILIISAMAVAPVFGQAKKQIVLGKIVYTFEHAYHQNIMKEWQSYGPSKYKIKVVVLDGQASNEKTLAALENLIAQKVDGIAIHSADAALQTKMIKLSHAAGIPIVSTLIRPTENLAPHIQPDEGPSSYKMGAVAATQWLKAFPNKPCRVAMLDFGGMAWVEEIRTGAFFKGVKSVDPQAVLVTQQNGEGSSMKSMEKMLDILQANPEINIIFGSNDEEGLGALSACEQLGRGKMKNGVPLTEIIAGLDGNIGAMLKVYNPSSSFKMTHGAVRDNARAEIDTLMRIIRKEIPMNLFFEQKVVSKEFDYWTVPIAEAQKFLEENFFYKGNLKVEALK